jgi:hypothetical protein
MMNYGPIVNATLQRKTTESCPHKQDIEQFMEISYTQIRLSIADIIIV